MKDVSIIKRIDELGRIVLPIDIRKKLKITTEDDLGITLEDDSIIIKKYSELSDIENKINIYGNIINKMTNKNIIITSKDKIIFSNKKDFINKELSDYLKKLINEIEDIDKKDDIEIIKNINISNNFYIKNIIINSKSIGLIILYNDDILSLEDKLLIKIILLLFNDCLVN